MIVRLLCSALVAAVTVFLPEASTAQERAPDLVITNARLIDGTGRAPRPATIAISGDRILSVTEGDLDVGDAAVVDAAGRTVLPGLIDAHVHLLLGGDAPPAQSDSALAVLIRNELPGELEAYLQAGITTVMSNADFWPYIRDVRARLQAGELRGPRIALTAGPAFTAPGGHPSITVCTGELRLSYEEQAVNWCREHLAREVETEEEARAAVDLLASQGVDAIKMVYDEFDGPGGAAKLNPDLVGVIAEAAHDNGLPTYTHSTHTADAIHAIERGVDRLVHHVSKVSAPGDMQRLVELMRAEDVTMATTVLIIDELADRFAAAGDSGAARFMTGLVETAQETISVIAERDADLIALGTDAPTDPPLIPAGEAFHREVDLLREAGLTPSQIIKAATRNAAVHIYRADDLGTVEPGKLADLIIVNGDPLNDLAALRNVDVVVLGGEVVVDEPGE